MPLRMINVHINLYIPIEPTVGRLKWPSALKMRTVYWTSCPDLVIVIQTMKDVVRDTKCPY